MTEVRFARTRLASVLFFCLASRAKASAVNLIYFDACVTCVRRKDLRRNNVHTVQVSLYISRYPHSIRLPPIHVLWKMHAKAKFRFILSTSVTCVPGHMLVDILVCCSFSCPPPKLSVAIALQVSFFLSNNKEVEVNSTAKIILADSGCPFCSPTTR